MNLLSKEDTLFVLVDVQGKLAEIVQDSEKVIKSLKNLIQGLRILGIPVIWLEQYPEGLGLTDEELREHLAGLEPIRKVTFDGCKTPEFIDAVEETGRRQILVAGIETHICVYQTAASLKSLGFEVEVVVDAVSSRTILNKEIGLEKMKSIGIKWTSVEMALYELMQTADGEPFKRILKLLK